MTSKMLCGLKFKAVLYDKLWQKKYTERWVCDLGYYQISITLVKEQKFKSQYKYTCIVNNDRGYFREEGDTLEMSLEKILKLGSEDPYLTRSFLKDVECARKGKLNLKQRHDLPYNSFMVFMALLVVLDIAIIWASH